MPLAFQYDPRKAAINLRKHGVSFLEAMTVFGDPLSSTLPDDQHSEDESRWIVIGKSSSHRILFVVTLKPTPASASSVPALLPQPRFDNMKKSREPDSLAERPALDFSKGVRGKHHKRVEEGTNIVLIAPELMETFPDSDSVNEALRSLKKIADRTPRRA